MEGVREMVQVKQDVNIVEPEFPDLDHALAWIRSQPNVIGFQGYQDSKGKWHVVAFEQ